MGYFFNVTKRCIRCRKPERNDGTEENPVWACDNPDCVRFKPKETTPAEQVEGGDADGARDAGVQTSKARTTKRKNTKVG